METVSGGTSPRSALLRLFCFRELEFSFKGLCQLGPWPAQEVAALLRELADERLIRSPAPGSYTALGERYGTDIRPEPAGAFGKGLCLLRAGALMEGCELLLAEVNRGLREDRSAAVLILLDILLLTLKKWPWDENSPPESLQDFLAIYRKSLNISLYISKRMRETLDLLPKASAMALFLGNERVKLVLKLTASIHLHMTPEHNTQRPRELLEQTLEAIATLGDKDIMAQTMLHIGMLHFMQANYHEAISFLERATATQFIQHNEYLEESRARYIASAACNLGLPAKACGVLSCALAEMKATGNRVAQKWMAAQLADSLLRLGRPERALEILDGLIPCCDSEAETRLWNWVMRSLAHYHYLMGHIVQSHLIMSSIMETSLREGLARPYYGGGWLLQMLWAYEERGLPRVPGFDLDREVDMALASPNGHLKGRALLIRARQLLRQAGREKEARKLLLRALALAKKTGCPKDLALARQALGECLPGLSPPRARLLRASAEKILARYAQTLETTYDARLRGGQPPDGETCLGKLKKAVTRLASTSTLAEQLTQLLQCACDILEVERGAIFARGGGAPLAAYNFSPAEAAALGKDMLEQAGDVPPGEATLWRSGDAAKLLLRLRITKEKLWLVYLESVYFPANIVHQRDSVFHDAARILENEIQIALRFTARQPAPDENFSIPSHVSAFVSVEKPLYGEGMRHLLQKAEMAARTDASVLILGETGVGKEMLARHIHEHSDRTGPFIALHPASLSGQLVESELFGHEKGAFTGAIRQKQGLAEIASEGTLFIDEIGDVPLGMQIKLLRLLQEKTYMRVGGVRELHTNFRLITATNRDLDRLIAEGQFRRDLYYRISIIALTIPPLRERVCDIPPLVEHYARIFSAKHKRADLHMETQELRRLCAYSWPGNVRELRNSLERAVILHTRGPLVVPDIAQEKLQPPSPSAREAAPGALWDDLPPLEELERRYIRHVLRKTRGKVDGENGALSILGMKRSTLYARMQRWKLKAVDLLYGEDAEPGDTGP